MIETAEIVLPDGTPVSVLSKQGDIGAPVLMLRSHSRIAAILAISRLTLWATLRTVLHFIATNCGSFCPRVPPGTLR